MNAVEAIAYAAKGQPVRRVAWDLWGPLGIVASFNPRPREGVSNFQLRNARDNTWEGGYTLTSEDILADDWILLTLKL